MSKTATTHLDVVLDWPVGEALLIAEVAQVVHAAEELVLELRVRHKRDRAVLQTDKGGREVERSRERSRER